MVKTDKTNKSLLLGTTNEKPLSDMVVGPGSRSADINVSREQGNEPGNGETVDRRGCLLWLLIPLGCGLGVWGVNKFTTDYKPPEREDALTAFRNKQTELGLLDLGEMQEALRRLKETLPRPPTENLGSYVSSDEWLHGTKVNKINAEKLYHQLGVNILIAADTLRSFGAPDEVGRKVANDRRNQWSENTFERGVVLESPPYGGHWDPPRRLAEALQRDRKNNSFPELARGSSHDYITRQGWPSNWPEYVIRRLETDLQQFSEMFELLRTTR
jgi:hypothetical protein